MAAIVKAVSQITRFTTPSFWNIAGKALLHGGAESTSPPTDHAGIPAPFIAVLRLQREPQRNLDPGNAGWREP